LSKVIYELCFTSAIAPINDNQNITLPNGCGIVNPDANPIKNIKANTRFQKLSLLSLEAIKPVCSVATLCISRALAALRASTNSVKSSISTSLYYCFKTYNFSIANLKWFLKLIMQLLIGLSLCLPISNTMATPVNNRDTRGIRGMITKAEVEYQIPFGLLSAIAKVESNIKEFAVNVGGKATYATSLAEAVSVANAQINVGKQNIDLGVMQLNYRWHGNQFSSLEEMLTPKKNIAYAAGLLSSLYKQHGNWQLAIRHYHSANPKYSSKYSRKVTMAWLSD
jgi:soluble lytic murein transglycosylase-like protein